MCFHCGHVAHWLGRWVSRPKVLGSIRTLTGCTGELSVVGSRLISQCLWAGVSVRDENNCSCPFLVFRNSPDLWMKTLMKQKCILNNQWKACADFFFFQSVDIKKNIKRPGFRMHRQTRFFDFDKSICTKISKKNKSIINPAWVGAPSRVFFFFSEKKIWFLLNCNSLSKTVYSIFHSRKSVIKYSTH